LSVEEVFGWEGKANRSPLLIQGTSSREKRRKNLGTSTFLSDSHGETRPQKKGKDGHFQPTFSSNHSVQNLVVKSDKSLILSLLKVRWATK